MLRSESCAWFSTLTPPTARNTSAPIRAGRRMVHTRPVDRVLVVGAGVIGLSCALRLLEAGHRVDVLARDLPRETVSAVAAAIWYPYRAWPEDRVLAWSRAAYDEFAQIAAGHADSGVVLREGTEVVSRRDERPWWAEAVPDLRETIDVPAGFDGGWAFVSPVIEMPVYLDWLASRVLEEGGSITRLNLHGLPRTGEGGPSAVVDCSGIGARFLAADLTVHPVQGQVVLVEQVGLDRWWLGNDVRRGSDVRRPALARHRGRRHRRRGRVEPDAVAGGGRARSCAGRCGWCRSWPGPRCSATGSGCARRGPRCGWNGSATSCTATATAGPG